MQHILMHQHAACWLRLDEQPDARVGVAEERLCVPLGPPLLIEVHDEGHEQRLASGTILVPPIRAQPVTSAGEASWIGIHVPLECIAPDWCVRDKGCGVVRGGPSYRPSSSVRTDGHIGTVANVELGEELRQPRLHLDDARWRAPLERLEQRGLEPPRARESRTCDIRRSEGIRRDSDRWHGNHA